MTSSRFVTTTITAGLDYDPEAKVEARHLPVPVGTADVNVTFQGSELSAATISVYMTHAQARQLRRELSKALESYYVEHPEQLGADIEADLTMNLVPDLPDVSIDEAVQRG